MLDSGRFQINDVVLNIPPTEIKISRNSFDQRMDNLRTVGSSVVKSNFSNLNIQFSAVFTDQGEGQTGFEDLRDLIAQFRLTPFCYAENRFLGESIFGDAEKSTMTLALVNMTISMSAGDTINAIKVLFSFNYFNHTPYVHEYRYRKSIFLDTSHNTLDPRESEAWKMFYKAEQDKRGYTKFPIFTDSDGEQLTDTTLEYYKYQIFTSKALKTRMMETDALLTSAAFTRATYDQVLQLKPPGDAFATSRTELNLLDNYLVRTNEQQLHDFKLEMESAMLTANDLELSPLQIIANSERWDLFSDLLPDQWEAIRLKDGNFATLTAERTPTSTRKAALESKDGDLILCRKKQFLNIDSSNIVPIGISINFSNRLATIPLVGAEHPTFQYLGGSDATVSISFMTTDNSALEELSRFHAIWKEQRLLMRSIPAGLKKITVVNDLLNMCGLHTFLLQAIDIGTVPGQPETKQISFDLIENAKPDLSEEKLTYEPMKPGYNAAKFGKTVFDYMIEYLDRAALAGGGSYRVADGTYSNWSASRMFDFEGIGAKKRISLKLDFVREWNSWVLDDEFSLLFKADVPGKIGQQIVKRRNKFKTVGSYSRHAWAGDELAYGKMDLRSGDMYFLGFDSEHAYHTGTAKYSDWMTSIGNNQELDSVERNVLYRLKKYSKESGLTSWAIRKLLLDFDVIFSKFVIGLLDYYQGQENPPIHTSSMDTAGGMTIRNAAYKKQQFLNEKAYAAEHVLSLLKNEDLIGIEEALIDVKAIIKNVSLADDVGAAFYDHRQESIKNTGAYLKSKENRKEEIEQSRYVDDFFNLPFVMEYMVNVKGLIQRVTTSSLFLDLPEFSHIKEAIEDAKVHAGMNAYPDFPMSQFLERVKAHKLGPDYLSKLEDKVSMLNNKFMSGHKFISTQTFFGPDLYLCDIPVFADQLLDTSLLTDASNEIISSYSGKEGKTESINSWLTSAIDKNTSAKRRSRLYDELINIGGTEAESGKVSTASELRAARSNPNAFLENQGHGQSVKGAAVQNDITIHTYDERAPDRKNKKDAIAHKIKSVRPIENHTEYQAMLKTKYANIAGLTETQRKMIKLPQFMWPTHQYKERTGISVRYDETGSKVGRKHTAIDIVSVMPNTPTDTLPIFATATGKIISITKIDRDPKGTPLAGKYSNWLEYSEAKLSAETWSAEERNTLKSKPVEYSRGAALRGGLGVTIQHEGGWTSYYGHLKNDSIYAELLERWEISGENLLVKQGDVIGTVGNTGRSTGAHLHFQLKKNNVPQDPKKLIIDKKLEKKAFPPGTYTPTTQPLNKAHEQLQTSLNNQRGLIRAYPTYKFFFVESDAGERHFFGFDDFFSYQAIQDIQLIRSANNPADLLIIKITNLSGYLTNRRFKDARQNQNTLQASVIGGNDQDGKAIKASEDVRNMMHADTINENPIESLFLKEGTQVQLRMGYSPNPSELENVFDGLIMDIQFHNTDDVITLVCQSFGMELAAGVIGLNEPEVFEANSNDDKDRSRTGIIMEELLGYPELKHFGRYEPSTTITGGGSPISWKPWEVVAEIADSNVFPPVVGLEDRSKFVAYKTTIWDIAQELAHRHPGYIAYPVSYDGEWGPRMTLFFGLASGSYVARDSNWDEKETVRLIELINRQETEGVADVTAKKAALDKLLDPSFSEHDAKLRTFYSKLGEDKGKDVWADETFWSTSIGGKSYWHTLGMDFAIADKIKMFARKRQIIKPFRNYHLISSDHNLIANNIISSAYSTFNAATVEYSSSEQEVDKQALQFGSPETLSVVADSVIPEEEIRELYAGFENCYGREQAKRYAQSLLWKSMKKGYRGSFTICGNAEIKPHDICYVYDTYTDMHGPVEVEQVVHRFSHQTGFVTEIIPMMCVHTNETATMPTIDVLGIMLENWLGQDNFKTAKTISKHEEFFTGGLMGFGGATALNYGLAAKVATWLSAVAVGGAAGTLVAGLSWAAVAGGLLYSGASLFGILDDEPDQEGSTGLLGDLGLFMFRKYITRTQMAHLFEYSPLIVRGRPLLGGLPTKTKQPGSFMQGWWDGKVKWWNEGKEARPILDFELQMLNNPENFPDYNLQNLRGALGEQEE